jgi:hypothetical protein
VQAGAFSVIGAALRRRWILALLPGLVSPALADLPEPPPLPSLPEAISPDVQDCVSRFGHTGCAARLYARLLCDSVGQVSSSELLQQQLAQQYEQAAIDFRGISVEQVETAAVRYYSPMLCPDKSQQIRQLFNQS